MDRAPELEQSYTRQSAFSYTCHGCSRCCYEKIIHVNPYEVARLAGNRGMSTTEFLACYTDAGGTTLKQTDTGACVFLTAQGCGVHPDRPLVCRVYPLGRRASADGAETFHELTPHPQTEGTYGTAGTVQSYLTVQEAEPFIEAVDRYVAVVGRLSAALERRMKADPTVTEQVRQAVHESLRGTESRVPECMDMDVAVGDYCVSRGIPAPPDLSTKTSTHLQALEEWVNESI